MKSSDSTKFIMRNTVVEHVISINSLFITSHFDVCFELRKPTVPHRRARAYSSELEGASAAIAVARCYQHIDIHSM